MVKIVLVEKNGSLKESQLKSENEELFYKNCGYRNSNYFDLEARWETTGGYISLYCKTNGRAGSENKYELPPPVDSNLYFGKLMLVKHDKKDLFDSELKDLTVEEWKETYEKLFGGFEDLDEEEETSEDEEIDPSMLTKEGYSKEDGFIVDDDEDEDYIPEDEDEEEEEEEQYIGSENEGSGEGEEEEEGVEEGEESEEYETDDSIDASELSEEDYLSSD
tara:strand:- start:80 stop:739 length:660 start_codon:yes stop_codon:yes gene_type:complete